jgi:hypothetical protein
VISKRGIREESVEGWVETIPLGDDSKGMAP